MRRQQQRRQGDSISLLIPSIYVLRSSLRKRLRSGSGWKTHSPSEGRGSRSSRIRDHVRSYQIPSLSSPAKNADRTLRLSENLFVSPASASSKGRRPPTGPQRVPFKVPRPLFHFPRARAQSHIGQSARREKNWSAGEAGGGRPPRWSPRQATKARMNHTLATDRRCLCSGEQHISRSGDFVIFRGGEVRGNSFLPIKQPHNV
jgi:hypothetical protein